jgi:hypothetical protein
MKRGNKQTLLAFFFVVAVYHNNVIEAGAIATESW